MALASEDIGDQHRRTTLGPIWLAINYLIYVGTFLVIFGEHPPMPHFAAYIATGMLLFQYIQETVTQSVSLYSREENFIAGTTLPMSVYILRLTMQCAIRSGYAGLGCLFILAIDGAPFSAGSLWSLLGIAIVLIATPAVITVFATAGAYFPDLQFVVANFIRVSIFLTPIFWVRTDGIRGTLYHWNPITHFIEIVRYPIVYDEFPVYSFSICVIMTIAIWILALFLLGMTRKQIVFLL